MSSQPDSRIPKILQGMLTKEFPVLVKPDIIAVDGTIIQRGHIMKKLVLHSGGMDSVAMMLDCIEKYGAENVISMGFDYRQKHYQLENDAAWNFCNKRGIKRVTVDVNIGIFGGSSLTDPNLEVTTDMSKQRSTVVPQRNAIFLMLAAAFAQENDCDEIWHGAVAEDFEAYRDCRDTFFRLIEMTIQAGRTQPIKGNENITKDFVFSGYLDNKTLNPMGSVSIPRDRLDITIETPLMYEKKEDTVKRIIAKYGVEVYKDSYSCYNGTVPPCGKCPACQERQKAFEVNGVKDPA